MRTSRVAAIAAATAVLSGAIGFGIPKANSETKRPSAVGQEMDRATIGSRRAVRGEVMTFSVNASGNVTSNNAFTFPEDVSIDVETVVIENGAYASNLTDRVGIVFQRSSPEGTDYQYFNADGFATQVLNFSPPLRVQGGDSLFFYDAQDSNIGGFIQISFHGRIVPQATGIQAR